MTESGQDDAGGQYGGPPRSGDYGTAPYPQSSYPQSQSPYPQAPPPSPYPQPGYPPQPYPYAYPPPVAYGYPPVPYAYQPVPSGPRRPGIATAASVIGFVNAGLLILAGALLLFGASVASDIEDAGGRNTDYDLEFGVDGFLNLLAAGLIIAGAVMLVSRKSSGRIVFAVGNGIVVAEAIYWLVRFSDQYAAGGRVVWAILFAALAILPLTFIFVPDVNKWMNAAEQ